MTSRERVLAHLEGRPVDRLPLMPITMMFASEQIGARYRDYCTDYRVLAEGQIRTAEAFGFDYVNTMSDPAREAADCGARVEYFDNQPVAIVEEQALLRTRPGSPPSKSPTRWRRRMHNGIKALPCCRERVGKDKIVEGWIEGPIAEAADLRGINTLMMDFFDDPAFVRDLFAFVIELELRFAREQIKAGADIIGVGDAAASLVGPQIYEEFVWPYEKQLVDGIHALGGKGPAAHLRQHSPDLGGNGQARLRHCGPGLAGSDLRSAPEDGPRRRPARQLEPGEGPAQWRPGGRDARLSDCHRQAGPRFIVGAGCEVPRDTPAENLRALCAYARSHPPRVNLEG